MSDLEVLSNRQLHAKCLEIGLNIPVTDSSRSVIIRKLQKISSQQVSPRAPRKNNRRETVHETQTYSAEPESNDGNMNLSNNRKQSKSPARMNNRRTIAITSAASVEPKAANVNENLGNTKKSITHVVPMEVDFSDSASEEVNIEYSRSGPTNYNFVTPLSKPHAPQFQSVHSPLQTVSTAKAPFTPPRLFLSQSKVTTTAYDQASRDLDDLPPLGVQPRMSPASSARSTPTDDWPRSRRSSSLSKSGVMTTSYRQEVAPSPKSDFIAEELDEEHNVLDYGHYDDANYNRSQYQTLLQQNSIKKLPFERVENKNFTNNTLNSTSYCDYNTIKKLPLENVEKNIHSSTLNSTSYGNYNNTTDGRPFTSFDNQQKNYRSSNMSNFNSPLTGSTRKENIKRATTTVVNAAPNLVGTSPQLYPNLSSFQDPLNVSHNYHLETDIDTDQRLDTTELSEDEISSSETEETPYLSNFSRKLENVQAQKIPSSVTSAVRRKQLPLGSSSTTSQYRTSTSKAYTEVDEFEDDAYSKQSPVYINHAGPVRRRPLDEDEENSVGESFQEFLSTLNRKYHIKQWFFMFLIFSLAILIYVVFFEKEISN